MKWYYIDGGKTPTGKKNKTFREKVASTAKTIAKKSREYADELEKEFLDSMKKLNSQMASGVNPERVLALSKLGAAYILRGTANVADAISKAADVAISKDEMGQIMSAAKKIAANAQSRIAEEAESETLASRVIPKGKGSKTATNLSEVSLKDMFREQAENGVNGFKEALPNVGKLVRASGINATDAQTRDVYDSYIKEPGVLSTDEIKKIIAAYRQEAQLLSKINDAEKGVRPHKIGAPRFSSSQEARTYQKELDDLMKNVTFSGDKNPTDIASPLDAKKTWMQNEIDDMERAIALHEERFQGENGITDQGDIEYQKKKAQLEDVRKRYAEAFPKAPLTQEETLAILIRQEEKILARWDQRVIDAKSGKFKSNERTELPYSERLAELQYQRDNAKDEVARLYELQNPSKRARDAQRKRALAAVKEMERRMAAGDYTTPITQMLDLSDDAPAMAAYLAREQTKKEYEQFLKKAGELSKAAAPVEEAASEQTEEENEAELFTLFGKREPRPSEQATSVAIPESETVKPTETALKVENALEGAVAQREKGRKPKPKAKAEPEVEEVEDQTKSYTSPEEQIRAMLQRSRNPQKGAAPVIPSNHANNGERFSKGRRNVIVDVGRQLLMGVLALGFAFGGIIIHLWAVGIAYRVKGLFAAVITLIFPGGSEVYWAIFARDNPGTISNLYTIVFLAYLGLCMLCWVVEHVVKNLLEGLTSNKAIATYGIFNYMQLIIFGCERDGNLVFPPVVGAISLIVGVLFVVAATIRLWKNARIVSILFLCSFALLCILEFIGGVITPIYGSPLVLLTNISRIISLIAYIWVVIKLYKTKSVDRMYD